MPITRYDDEYIESARPDHAPTVAVRFGAGDTRLVRVWTGPDKAPGGPVEFRMYAAPAVPVGTIVEPNSPDAVASTAKRPAVVLAFPDAASARLVLDFLAAQLETDTGRLSPAVTADPRYKPAPGGA